MQEAISRLGAPCYNLVGNHDAAHAPRRAITGRDEDCFAFELAGLTWLALDCNFTADGRREDADTPFSWTEAALPPEQVRFLREALDAEGGPVVILSHHPLVGRPRRSARHPQSGRGAIRHPGRAQEGAGAVRGTLSPRRAAQPGRHSGVRTARPVRGRALPLRRGHGQRRRSVCPPEGRIYALSLRSMLDFAAGTVQKAARVVSYTVVTYDMMSGRIPALDCQKTRESSRGPQPFRPGSARLHSLPHLRKTGGANAQRGHGAIFASENPIFQRKNRFLAGSAPEKSSIFSGDW